MIFNVPAALIAAFGLGLAIYAAMELEPEEVGRRSAWGVLGVALVVLGVMLL